MNNDHCFSAEVVSQAPECLVLNIGSNNIRFAKNPNQVVIYLNGTLFTKSWSMKYYIEKTYLIEKLMM